MNTYNASIKLEDWTEIEDYQNILYYGLFGVGKTVLAGTSVLVPEMQDVLCLSLEGGENALKQLKYLSPLGKDVFKHLQVIKVQTFKQYASIYKFLKLHVQFRDANDIKNLRKLEAQLRGVPNVGSMTDEELAKKIPEPKKFKTVITDSLTEAQKYCMYQLLGIDPKTHSLDEVPRAAEWSK